MKKYLNLFSLLLNLLPLFDEVSAESAQRIPKALQALVELDSFVIEKIYDLTHVLQGTSLIILPFNQVRNVAADHVFRIVYKPTPIAIDYALFPLFLLVLHCAIKVVQVVRLDKNEQRVLKLAGFLVHVLKGNLADYLEETLYHDQLKSGLVVLHLLACSLLAGFNRRFGTSEVPVGYLICPFLQGFQPRNHDEPVRPLLQTRDQPLEISESPMDLHGFLHLSQALKLVLRLNFIYYLIIDLFLTDHFKLYPRYFSVRYVQVYLSEL